MNRTKTLGTILGTFGKGLPGSVTVNFSVSGGRHCASTCPLKGAGCYAETAQKRKPSITTNLERHQENFSDYLEALNAYSTVDTLRSAPWVRFNAFGSIPAPAHWSDKDRENLARLASQLDHSKVHFPVETVHKATTLRRLGFPTVRVSDGEADTARAVGLPISIVGPTTKVITGSMSKDRKREVAEPSYALAKELRQLGEKVVVCPAIVNGSKCGDCTACASPAVTTVIYPRHV